MATLAIKIDPTDAQAGARVIKREMADINRSAESVERGVARTGRTSTDTFQGMARGSAIASRGISSLATVAATSFATIATSMLAAFSVKPLFDFKNAMAEVSTLVDTATFDLKALERAAIEQSRAFGGTATAQTKAYYQIISAGASSAAEATNILTTANKLALGGVTDVQTAADGLTSVLNAYGSGIESAASASDAMFVAMRAGKTTIGELSGSLGKIAPLASQAGVSFDELLASVSALTKGGLSTDVASTGVRAILAAIVKPTKEASDMAESLGLNFSAAALKSKGFAGFLDDIAAKTGGSTEALTQLFGGVEALVPAMALAGAAGQDFSNILEQMGQKAGSTQDAVDKMANSPGFQAGRVWSNLQAEILGTSTAFSDNMVSALKATADNMGALVKVVGIFAAGHLGAAAVSAAAAMVSLSGSIGLATIAARGLSASIAFLGGPIGASIMALAGVYYYLSTRTDETKEASVRLSAAHETLRKRILETDAANKMSVTSTGDAAKETLTATRATLLRAQAELSLSQAINEQGLRNRRYAEGGRSYSFSELSAERQAAERAAANQNDPLATSLQATVTDLTRQVFDTESSMTALSVTSSILARSIDGISESSTSAGAALSAMADKAAMLNTFGIGGTGSSGVSGAFSAQTKSLTDYIERADTAAKATAAIADAQKQLGTFAEDALSKVAGLTDKAAAGYGNVRSAIEGLAKEAANASISEAAVVSRLKDIEVGLRGLGVGETVIMRIVGAMGSLIGVANGATAAIKQLNAAQNQTVYSVPSASGGTAGVNVTRHTGGGTTSGAGGSIDPNTGIWHRSGFARGDYTGNGGKFEPAGVVHKGEFVFTKEQTSALGVGTLRAIAQSAAKGYATGGPVGIPSSISASLGGMVLDQIEINTAATVDQIKRTIGYLDTIESDLLALISEIRAGRSFGGVSAGSVGSSGGGSVGGFSGGTSGKFGSLKGTGSAVARTQREIAESLGMNYIPGLRYYENGAVIGQGADRATQGTGMGWFDATNPGSHWSDASRSGGNWGSSIVSKFATGGMIAPGGSGPASGDKQKVQLFKNPDEAVYVLTGAQRAAMRDMGQAANNNAPNSPAITLNITMPVMDTVNPSSRKATLDELAATVRRATSRTNG